MHNFKDYFLNVGNKPETTVKINQKKHELTKSPFTPSVFQRMILELCHKVGILFLIQIHYFSDGIASEAIVFVVRIFFIWSEVFFVKWDLTSGRILR